jgi:hypothetical protein
MAKKINSITRGGNSAVTPCKMIFFVAVLAPIIILTGFPACQKNNDTSNTRNYSDDTDDDQGGGNEPDYALCLQVFDDVTSRCGAQFYDKSGYLLTQNDLVKACGQPNVRCVVACYQAGSDCDLFRSCLKSSCRLQ